jgi:hypothetical protein
VKQAVPILTALLFVQVALTFGIRHFESQRAAPSTEKLIKADFSRVDKIELEAKNNKLVIEKSGNVWLLPAKANFPASAEAVNRLLDRLKGYTRGWPVAKTEDAAPRFRVAANNFEEKISLKTSGKDVATIFLGSAAGYNKLHMRVDKQTEINAVELPATEMSLGVDDWIDRGLIELNPDDINAVELPQFTVARKQKAFEMTSDGKVTLLDATTAGEVFEYAAGVNVSDVLGRVDKPEYGMASPAYSYTVTKKDGGKLKYSFGRLAGSNFYVIKQPTGDFYLKVDAWFVDRLKEMIPGALIARSDQLRKLREAADKAMLEKTKGMQPVVPTEVPKRP